MAITAKNELLGMVRELSERDCEVWLDFLQPLICDDSDHDKKVDGCYFCNRPMPGTIEQTIEADWIPSFWMIDHTRIPKEVGWGICPQCQKRHLRFNEEEGDYELKIRTAIDQHVAPELGCPRCGETDTEQLVFRGSANTIKCQNCGHVFDGDDWAK